MEMFNVLPTRNEDAIGVLSSMLETAVFLRNSNFDRISSELIDASCEYINALKKYSQPYNHPKVKPTGADLPTDYIPYNIGNRIQIAREEIGMSEDDLAEKLNIHPGDVLAWEDSTDQLPAEMIIPLANALKCDPMWLLGDSESNAPVKVMQNVDVSTIGKRIGVARVKQRMYTEELENAIHAPEGSVFRWETGKAIPSSQYIDNLAKALNTSVTWLLTGKVTHQDLSGVGKQQHLPASQRADVLSHEAPQR